jgi:cytidylate kinase
MDATLARLCFPTRRKILSNRGCEERARRRFDEWREVDGTADYQEILVDLIERDRRDSTRADSPLKRADDAIVIESTGKSIDDVFQEMLKIIETQQARAIQ